MFTSDTCPQQCPGCKHREFTKDESINRKTDFLKVKLKPWFDKLEDIRFLNGRAPINYRTKVCLHTRQIDGVWKYGMIHKQTFIPIEHCPIQSSFVNKCLEVLFKILPNEDVFPMRFYLQSGRQIMLVLKTKIMADTGFLNEKLTTILKQYGVEGIWLHLNPSAGHKIFMKHGFYLLWGNEFSFDESGMMYGVMSFAQQIPELYLKSLELALEFLKPDSKSIVIDLYSGIGYSSALWQKSGAKSIAVELNGEAVICFKNNVRNVDILRGTCRNRIPQLNEFVKINSPNMRLLYVNPPRTGIENTVLKWIADEYKPIKISYLSCSPGTLARDLLILENAHYKVIKIIPFDFFPKTHHIECLALIARA